MYLFPLLPTAVMFRALWLVEPLATDLCRPMTTLNTWRVAIAPANDSETCDLYKYIWNVAKTTKMRELFSA